jgi:hypothetical protein
VSALDTLLAAVSDAVRTYDASGDHSHNGSPVPGDCIRCRIVRELPESYRRAIRDAADARTRALFARARAGQ